MENGNDGGPVFPIAMIDSQGDCIDSQQQGMTLRDWYAGQALAGLLSHSGMHKTEIKIEFVCDAAYDYAETMIRLRPYFDSKNE